MASRKAKDGDPLANDDLARKRAEKSGTSVDERTDEPEEELFPLGSVAGDPRVSHKNLIKAGAKVSVKASLSSAAVPIVGGGLFDPEAETTFLVRALPGALRQVPKHEERGGRQVVKEWDLVQDLRPVHVQDASEVYLREQVLEILHAAGVPEATVTKLLGNGVEAQTAT